VCEGDVHGVGGNEEGAVGVEGGVKGGWEREKVDGGVGMGEKE